MRKWWPWILAVFLSLLLLGSIFYVILNEEKPESFTHYNAEKITDQIFEAVNKKAWDSLGVIQWTFPGGHHYVWNVQQNIVLVSWDNHQILLEPDTKKGYRNGIPLTKTEDLELVEQAYANYCNDGFWLRAFTMLRDPGTIRELVVTEEGDSCLLITFQSGGVTPGDSYLWQVDDSGRPLSCKMWVSIIPIGGMSFTWEEWDTLYNGALVATTHKSVGPTIELTNIQAGQTVEDLGLPLSLFSRSPK